MSSSIHVSHHHIHHHNPQPISASISKKLKELCNESLEILSQKRDRLTSRAFIRAGLALIGEGVKEIDHKEELEAAGAAQDEDDFEECVGSVEGMTRKIHESLDDDERESVVTYLKSIYRIMGNSAAAGSLTPRPRDYAAAMSRFSEDALNSPTQMRGPTQQERLEHTHSKTHL